MSCASVPDEPFHGSLRISGTVTRDGAPVRGYVRLLDGRGEFVAEVPTNKQGGFTFFTAPGEWTLRLLSSGPAFELPVRLVDRDAPHFDIDL